MQRNWLELVLVIHVQAAEGKPSLGELTSRKAELLWLQGVEVLSERCSESGRVVMILDDVQMLLGSWWISCYGDAHGRIHDVFGNGSRIVR